MVVMMRADGHDDDDDTDTIVMMLTYGLFHAWFHVAHSMQVIPLKQSGNDSMEGANGEEDGGEWELFDQMVAFLREQIDDRSVPDRLNCAITLQAMHHQTGLDGEMEREGQLLRQLQSSKDRLHHISSRLEHD